MALDRASQATRITDLSSLANSFKNVFSGVGGWFSPGEPVTPVQAEAEPRQRQAQVGYNLQWTPRGTEETSFDQLRFFAANYDVARLAVQKRKEQLGGLEWDIIARDRGVGNKYDLEIKAAKKFFERPDKQYDWPVWLGMLLEDRLVIDAVTIYPRRSRSGGLYSLEVIDGSTIKPLVDNRGRIPDPPAPAYQQVLWGVPRGMWDSRRLLYLPQNVRSQTPYGFSEIEGILYIVNMALRKRIHDLAHFTESNIPKALLGVPNEWTAEQIKQYQEYLDQYLAGDLSRRSRLILTPSGGRGQIPLHEFAPFMGDPTFDLWLMKMTCAAFHVTPAELGFTDDVNKASSEGQENVTYRDAIKPLTKFVKGLMDRILNEYMGLPFLEFSWNFGEVEDKYKEAQTDQIYNTIGAIQLDELREKMGYKPYGVPPFIMTAMGPVFIDQMKAQALQMAQQTGLPPTPATGDSTASPPDKTWEGKMPPPYTPGFPQYSSTVNTAYGAGDGESAPPTQSNVGTIMMSAGSRPRPPVPDEQYQLARDDLRRWRTVALKAVKEGRVVKKFASNAIPEFLYKTVENELLELKQIAQPDRPTYIQKTFTKALDVLTEAQTKSTENIEKAETEGDYLPFVSLIQLQKAGPAGPTPVGPSVKPQQTFMGHSGHWITVHGGKHIFIREDGHAHVGEKAGNFVHPTSPEFFKHFMNHLGTPSLIERKTDPKSGADKEYILLHHDGSSPIEQQPHVVIKEKSDKLGKQYSPWFNKGGLTVPQWLPQARTPQEAFSIGHKALVSEHLTNTLHSMREAGVLHDHPSSVNGRPIFFTDSGNLRVGGKEIDVISKPEQLKKLGYPYYLTDKNFIFERQEYQDYRGKQERYSINVVDDEGHKLPSSAAIWSFGEGWYSSGSDKTFDTPGEAIAHAKEYMRKESTDRIIDIAKNLREIQGLRKYHQITDREVEPFLGNTKNSGWSLSRKGTVGGITKYELTRLSDELKIVVDLPYYNHRGYVGYRVEDRDGNILAAHITKDPEMNSERRARALANLLDQRVPSQIKLEPLPEWIDSLRDNHQKVAKGWIQGLPEAQNYVHGETNLAMLEPGRVKSFTINNVFNEIKRLGGVESITQDQEFMDKLKAEVVDEEDDDGWASKPRYKDPQKNVVDGLVHAWAGTSADDEPVSLAIQLAAEKEFGLPEWSDFRNRPSWNKAEELYQKHETALRNFIKAQYNATQKFFKKVGVSEVWAYRGMSFDSSYYSKDPPSERSGEGSLMMQPISSFSLDYETASSFAGHERGAIIAMRVPVENIVATPRGGVGCLGEHEIVVVGKPQKGYVHIYHTEDKKLHDEEAFLHHVVRKGSRSST